MPSFYQVEGISPRSLSVSVECWEQNVWLCAPNRGSALYRFQWYALSQFLLFFWGGLHRTLSSSWSSGLKYVNGLSFSIFAFWRIISPHFCKNQCSFNGADPGKQRWPIRVVTCDGLRAGPIRIFSGIFKLGTREPRSQIFSMEIIGQRSTDEGPRVCLHGSQVWVPMVPNIWKLIWKSTTSWLLGLY